MAAVLPTTVRQISVGSVTGFVVAFANTLDTGDTWASGITNILLVIPSQGDASGTATSTGVGASWTAAGVVTMTVSEDNTAVNLLVLAG